MAASKDTAEERLLRMIEGPRGGSPTVASRAAAVFSIQRLLGGWRSVTSRLTFRRRSRPAPRARQSGDGLLWRLLVVERVFWLILVALVAYVVVDLGVVAPARGRLPAVAMPQASQSPATDPGVSGAGNAGLRPLAEYREALMNRNPFGIASNQLGTSRMRGEQVRSRLQELAAMLKVVGLNRGRVPEAIIEDTAASRTYFVKVGDQVGEMTVTAIDQRGVTVTYEGEETLLQ